MFGGHQRSLYKYPSQEVQRSRNPLNQHPTDNLPIGHADYERTSSLTRDIGARSVPLPDFSGYQPGELPRPKSSASQKLGYAGRRNDVGAPPMPNLNQKPAPIPARTSSKQDEAGNRGPSPAPILMRSRSGSSSSAGSNDTKATSTLPALQAKGPPDEGDTLEPLLEDDPRSYNLVAPPDENTRAFSLEKRSEQLFSRRHLEIIFSDPAMLLEFTTYLSSCRPKSVPTLIYYLDSTKALRAIAYANAVAESLKPIRGHPFSTTRALPTVNSELEDKADQAFDVLVRDALPAYITHLYTRIVSLSITRRITGTLPPHLREASEGLAEVFCLTDPCRTDNPIVFASEEFHRTTQYGMSYVIGRNCRFLQGPKTNPYSVTRLREAMDSGRECVEVFLNYRRDGSSFMNLLMTAPLTDSRGRIRYFIGAQVDVSGIVKDCTDLESLRKLVDETNEQKDGNDEEVEKEQEKSEFQGLSEMFNLQELDTVRRHGGKMHREAQDDETETNSINNWNRPRLMLSETDVELNEVSASPHQSVRLSGKLSGVYQNYLLIRPYPSLRILFASPTLRVPGILQSPFINKIGGSPRVREELTQALADGRGVTARVRWLSRPDEDGRNRWIHCTPLLGSNTQIGVWMVVIVDEEKEHSRRYREAPPVNSNFQRAYPTQQNRDRPFNLVNTSPPLRHHGSDPAYGARKDSLNPPPSPSQTSQFSVRI